MRPPAATAPRWSAATLAALLLAGAVAGIAQGADAPPTPAAPPAAPAAPFVPSAARGYRHILDTPYIPPTFDDDDVDHLYTVWPAAERAAAEAATPAARRALTFARYGLTPRPDDPARPLQYVVDERGRWSLNCFSCHGGQVEEQVLPGLPNAHFAFQDLVDDVARLAAQRGDTPTAMATSLWRRIPLGTSHGTTNAVVFSMALGAFRDADLNLVLPKAAPKFVHHDLDAPPWWNVRARPRLYVDGVTKKSHRALMQFLMVPMNGPERFRAWDDDFKDVLAYLESVPVPRWPGAVDAPLAAAGRVAFERTCAPCHGTYGETPTYPSVVVPVDEVGTDRVRHDAIPRSERERYARSWFVDGRPGDVDLDPKGYVAPPLHGVWASAPYFHNGAVPTLWHVLHPEARPAAWRRKGPSAYDRVRVGLDVEAAEALPKDLADPWSRRRWFDTTAAGKSAAGHLYPATLSDEERRAVLEYLKTL